MSSKTLGLTEWEIAWLRANKDNHPLASKIVRMYEVVRNNLHDQQAREDFSKELAHWRMTREPPKRRGRR